MLRPLMWLPAEEDRIDVVVRKIAHLDSAFSASTCGRHHRRTLHASPGVPLNDFFRSAPDPDEVTVNDLAAELDASARTILDYAAWMRLAIDPLARTLSAADADRLRTLFAVTDGTPPSTARTEPIPRFLSGPVSTE